LIEQNILVTGGSGFFGRGFVLRALELGAKRVCVYSRGEYVQHLMRQGFRNDPRLRFFIGDVRDANRLRRAMEGVNLVVHAAALKRVEVGEYDSCEMARTNVYGAMNVIKAAHEAGVRKVVALSTDKAFHPVNAYGATKLVAEKLFLAANNDRGADGPIFAVTRYGNVAGSTGSVIPTWLAAKARGQTVELRDPDATRFWMTLDEAVALVVNTASSMRGGELVVPQLPAYRLGDLAEAMGVSYAVTQLQPGEKLHESMCDGNSSEHARRMSIPELKEALTHVV
jgi:UDP-N-acetylglucosamine 4,6-dehydratase/5-epimerase